MSIVNDPTRLFLPMMKVTGYSKIERGVGDAIGSVTLPYDPKNMESEFVNCICDHNTIGGESGESSFKKSNSSEIEVTFLLDDTTFSNIVAFGLPNNLIPDSVDKSIKSLLKICHSVDGKIHEPPYLTLKPLSMPLVNTAAGGFSGRLMSLKIQNEIVDMLGNRIKAQVKCRFKECLSDKQIKSITGKSSPDLTHVFQVKTGDRLTSIANNIYGDAEFVSSVAEFNELDTIRKMNVGAFMKYPPMER